MKNENKKNKTWNPITECAKKANIEKFGSASRGEIDELLMNKLSDVLSEKQKKNKIKNLLYSLAKKNIIKLNEKRQWVLT